MFYFNDGEQLTVYFADGSIATWNRKSPMFKDILNMCKNSQWFEVECLHKANKVIMNNLDNATMDIDGNLHVHCDKGEATFKPDTSKLTQFMGLLRAKGVFDTEIARIRPFLENMFANPFINAVTEIYDYCKAMDFEITDDGCFLAYKNVREDLGSIHDGGQTKHVIGEYTTVDAFDTDRNQTCSKGLHFCSKGYLDSYVGPITIVVKVNPKDVVAIPVDYDFLKGRCKRYLTVGILDRENGSLMKTYEEYQKWLQEKKEEEYRLQLAEEARQEAEHEELEAMAKKLREAGYEVCKEHPDFPFEDGDDEPDESDKQTCDGDCASCIANNIPKEDVHRIVQTIAHRDPFGFLLASLMTLKQQSEKKNNENNDKS